MLQTLHPSGAVTSYASTVMKAMQGEPVILVAAGIALMNEAEELLLLQRPDGE